jgi:acetyl esterase/lipase
MPSSSGSALPARKRSTRPLLAIFAALLCLLLTGATSAHATTTTTVRSDAYGLVYEHLLYGPRYRENLDVYASHTSRSPAVVLVHGGGWRTYDALSKFEGESLALQQQGFTVFTINYDQDTTTTPAFPLEPEDVVAATRWAIANAASFNADPANLFLLGGSAGGQLVAIVAQQLDAATPGTVKGVISLSGPENFRSLMALIEAKVVTNEEFVTSVYRALGRELEGPSYVFAKTFEQEAYEARWSPALDVVGANCPRWLLFNSQTELIPLSQAQEMSSRLTQAGCSSSLHVVPGSRHAFGYWKEAAPLVFGFIRGS